jgi:single-strand DNA-binding protein
MLRLTVLGNLGADATLRYSQKKTAIAQFRIAVNQVRTGADGERDESTEWVRVNAAGRQAEYASRLLKGQRVLVVGRLQITHFQRRDGSQGTGFDLWADEVINISGRGGGNGMEDPRTSERDVGGGPDRNRGTTMTSPSDRATAGGAHTPVLPGATTHSQVSNEVSEAATWTLGLVTDRLGHIHVGAVLNGDQAPVYADLLAAVGAASAAELDLTRLVILDHRDQVVELRRLAERCIDDARLRAGLVELTNMAMSELTRTP